MAPTIKWQKVCFLPLVWEVNNFKNRISHSNV